MVEVKELLSEISENKEGLLWDFGEDKGRPLLNATIVGTSSSFGIPRPANYNRLWDYFKETPELISLVSAIVTDTLSDGYKLDGPQTRVDRATKFLEDNDFDTLMEEWVYDALITGNGYLWKGRVTDEQVYDEVSSYAQNRGYPKEAVSEMFSQVYDEVAFDEPQKLGVVASSTMSIIPSDQYGTNIKYVQRVNGNVERYDADEIIHLRNIMMNGRLYGFSPVESVISEITLLSVLKNYTGNFFANNGTPNWVFILPKELEGSANHKALIKTLREYKKIENKQKNMVFTGEIDLKKLNDFTKDMEFKNLAEYLTKIIAMVWRVPPSMYGGEMKSSQTAGLSNQAYYRNIAHFQSKVENLLNRFLFKQFKVTFKFNKSYKEDEIREVQIEKTKTDIAEQRISLGLWSKEAAAKYLNINPKDFGDDEPASKTGKMGGTFIEKPTNMVDAPALEDRKKFTPVRNENLA